MSAGAFTNTLYEDDSGIFHPVRIQPETFSLTLNAVPNDAPTGPATPNIPGLKLSKGKREAGIVSRRVRFKITDANPPANYQTNSTLSLPVLTPGAYGSFGKNQVGTYTLNGIAYAIAYVGKTPEVQN